MSRIPPLKYLALYEVWEGTKDPENIASLVNYQTKFFNYYLGLIC